MSAALDAGTKVKWNRLMMKLKARIGRPPTLSPDDLHWLERISAAAVGFDRLAASALALLASEPRIIETPAGAALARLLSEYGYQTSADENERIAV